MDIDFLSRRPVFRYAVGVVIGVVGTLVAEHALPASWMQRTVVRAHRLASPLSISSDEPSQLCYLLPTGTVLYFDKAFPEGFTRYRVYVNIDRMPLPLATPADPTRIIPLEARAAPAR